jgi:hypothetical protein
MEVIAVILAAFGFRSLLWGIDNLMGAKAGMFFWITWMVVLLGGAMLGIWTAFYFSYAVGSTFRFVGFPIPCGLFHLQSGEWLDFPGRFPFAIAISDVIIVATVTVSPVSILLWMRRRNGRG